MWLGEDKYAYVENEFAEGGSVRYTKIFSQTKKAF